MTVSSSSVDAVRSRLAVAAAASLLFAATLAWRFLTFTGFSNDHYGHLALAQQLLLGDRPVRDFFDPGWPLTYLVSAAAWLAAGDSMATEWAITAAGFAAAAAFTVVAAHRLSGSLGIAVLVATLEVLIYPRTYAYPKLLPYALGAWAMLAMAGNPSRRRVLLMGAMIAVAFLLRHDHGLYIGVAAAICVAVASRAEGWRVAGRRVATLTGAAAASLLPWILFVALSGGLVGYFQTATEFAAAEANASNLRAWPRLSLVPGQPLLGLDRPNRPLAQIEWTSDTSDATRQALEQRYRIEYVREGDGTRFYYMYDPSDATVGALGDDPHVAGSAGLGRVRRPAWRELAAYLSPLRLAPALHSGANADAWLFWLFWTLPAVCGIIAARRLFLARERWPGESAVVVAVAVLAVVVNAGFLRDILRTRLPDAIVPVALLAAWALGLCWTGRWRRRSVQVLVQLGTVAILTVSVAAISDVAGLPERMATTGVGEGLEGVRARGVEVSRLLALPHRQDVAPPSRVSAALMPFFAYLDRCTSRSDRIIVTGEFPDVVVLAGRGFAGDGVVFGAWYSSRTHQDRSIDLLRMRSAPLAIHIDSNPQFRTQFGLVQAYLEREYELMTTIPTQGAGTIPILVQRNRIPVRTDPDTGWPCFQ